MIRTGIKAMKRLVKKEETKEIRDWFLSGLEFSAWYLAPSRFSELAYWWQNNWKSGRWRIGSEQGRGHGVKRLLQNQPPPLAWAQVSVAHWLHTHAHRHTHGPSIQSEDAMNIACGQMGKLKRKVWTWPWREIETVSVAEGRWLVK